MSTASSALAPAPLSALDDLYLRHTFALKAALACGPLLSNFRVYALLTFVMPVDNASEQQEQHQQQHAPAPAPADASPALFYTHHHDDSQASSSSSRALQHRHARGKDLAAQHRLAHTAPHVRWTTDETMANGFGGVQPHRLLHPEHKLEDGRQVYFVTGSNVETCFMGGGTCAERSALTQLRQIDYDRVLGVYLVSDMDSELTPGLLCREFLLQFLELDVPIVMASVSNANEQRGYTHRTVTLRELYPHPPLFLHMSSAHTASSMQQYASSTGTESFDRRFASSPDLLRLYSEARASTADDKCTSLHPLSLAAGALFADGTTMCTHGSKLLEFGYTLDPLTKLVPFIEAKAKQSIGVLACLQVDQYGVLHAPLAPARAHYNEAGWSSIRIVFHQPRSQQQRAAALYALELELIDTTFGELVRDAPALTEASLS